MNVWDFYTYVNMDFNTTLFCSMSTKKQTTCNHVGISNFVVNMITFFCNELRSQGCCIYNIDFVSFINRNKTTPNDWLNRSEVISNIGFMIRLE